MVTVYSKNNCVQCNLTKSLLNKRGAEYEEINVEENEEAFKYIKDDLGYLQAPVVVVNSTGESWSGFRPDLLEKL